MATQEEINQLMQHYGAKSEQELLEKLETEQSVPEKAQDLGERVPQRGMNVKQFIEGRGGKLIGAEDGIAVVEMPNAEGKLIKARFNPSEYIAGKGGDPTQFKIELNTADDALNESALGLADGIKFQLRQTPSSRLQFLRDRFGAENVKQMSEGAIKVKDADGIWKRGDSTFMQTLAAESPAISASMAGASLGGKVGAVIGAAAGAAVAAGATTATAGAALPAAAATTALGAAWGRNLGMAMGGAASYVATKWSTKEFAQKLGLVTQDDIDAYKAEVGKELVIQTAASLLIPPAIQAVGKATKATAQAGVAATKATAQAVTSLPVVGEVVGTAGTMVAYPFRTAGRIVHNFTNGPQLAEFMQGFFNKTKIDHWKTLYSNKENMKAVQSALTEQRVWLDNAKNMQAVDPLLIKMSSTVDDLLSKVSDGHKANYKAGMDFIRPYIQTAHVNIGNVADDFISELKTLNLLDDAGNFINKAAESSKVQVIADGPEREMVKHIYAEIQKLVRPAATNIKLENISVKKPVEGVITNIQKIKVQGENTVFAAAKSTGQKIKEYIVPSLKSERIPPKSLPTFDEAEQLLKAVDGILEKNNVFGAPAVIGSNMERILTQFRAKASTAISEGLRGQVRIPLTKDPTGPTISGAEAFIKLRQGYHDYRMQYEGVVKSLHADGVSKDGILRALSKNFANPGIDFRANFDKLAEPLGPIVKQTLNDLHIADAARGLAKDAFGMSGKFVPSIAYWLTGGPSGVATGRFIGWGPAIGAAKKTATESVKATADDLFKAQFLGKAVNFIKEQAPEAKQKLLGDPASWKQFMDVLGNSALTYDATKQYTDQQLGKR